MLIETGQGTVSVAVWDGNKLIHYGNIDINKLSGWTISRFDWEEITNNPEHASRQ